MLKQIHNPMLRSRQGASLFGDPSVCFAGWFLAAPKR